MFYIKTVRGWRLLHKRHYEVADHWRREGRDVEQQVRSLKPHDQWVSQRNYQYWEVKTRLVYGARQRAKKFAIKFDIGTTDFDIPDVCPLRGVPFKVGSGRHTDDSPTLDRKDPRLGYVVGNVWVISHKANRLKGDFTPGELARFCENAMSLDWVTWTSDDEKERQSRLAKWKRKLNEKHKPRWWALWGARQPK